MPGRSGCSCWLSKARQEKTCYLLNSHLHVVDLPLLPVLIHGLVKSSAQLTHRAVHYAAQDVLQQQQALQVCADCSAPYNLLHCSYTCGVAQSLQPLLLCWQPQHLGSSPGAPSPPTCLPATWCSAWLLERLQAMNPEAADLGRQL